MSAFKKNIFVGGIHLSLRGLDAMAVLAFVESLTCEESPHSLSSGVSNFQRWVFNLHPWVLRLWGLPGLSAEKARTPRAQAECQLLVPWLGSDFPAVLVTKPLTFLLMRCGPALSSI